MSFETPCKTLLGSALLAAVLTVFWSSYVPQYKPWKTLLQSQTSPEGFVCLPQPYATEIVSIDPLLIYINNFTTSIESHAIITAGSSSLRKSEIFINNQRTLSQDRTSKTAGLHPSLPAVSCLLSRARTFMGPLLSETDDFGVPQLVQYAPGEKFDVHHDWYDVPQVVKTGDESKRGKRFNRLASFFVFLENEGVVGGETWFPFVEVREDDEERDGMGKWRRHEEGGTAFRPRAGSALFWVNLHGNRTGDGRVVHAGLKVEEGRKTAMNIWPRKFY